MLETHTLLLATRMKITRFTIQSYKECGVLLYKDAQMRMTAREHGVGPRKVWSATLENKCGNILNGNVRYFAIRGKEDMASIDLSGNPMSNNFLDWL